jgi:hypothetical protein
MVLPASAGHHPRIPARKGRPHLRDRPAKAERQGAFKKPTAGRRRGLSVPAAASSTASCDRKGPISVVRCHRCPWAS